MLKNNPAGLKRAGTERVVGNQYNKLLRQQPDSKALSASGSTTTTDRGDKKKPRNRFEGNCFNCGRKGHCSEDCCSAKNKIGKSGHVPADKKGGGKGMCYFCGSEEHFAHKHCGLW